MQEDITEQLNKIKDTLDKYKGKAWILTPLPRTGDLKEISIPKYTQISVRTVWISPNKSDGEVYELAVKPGELILTKLGLQILGRAAGIRWKDPETLVSDSEPLVVCAKIIGSITDLDGSERSTPGAITLDYRDGAPQIKKKTTGQLAMARANIVALSETMVKNKVRRELLGIQGSYKFDDFAKPFVIFTLIPDQEAVLRDYPILRQALAVQQLGLGNSLFAKSIMEAPQHAIESWQQASLPTAAIEEEPKPKLIQASVDEMLKNPPAEEAGLSIKDDKVITASELYAKKGLSRPSSKPMLKDLTIEELDKVIEALGKLPDKEKKS